MVRSARPPGVTGAKRQVRGTGTMQALIFHGPGQIALEEIPSPTPGNGEVVVRVTLTTICGTDLHILHGEYPVKTRSDYRARAGGPDPRDRSGSLGIRGRRSGTGWGNHSMRPVQQLS